MRPNAPFATFYYGLTIDHFKWLYTPGLGGFTSFEMRLTLPRLSYTKLAGTLLALFILSQLLHVENYFEHSRTSQTYSNVLTLLEQSFWKRLTPKFIAKPAQRKPENLNSDLKNWDVIVQPFVSGGMFHVETPGCSIPRTNILPHKFSMWKKRFRSCAKTTVVTDLDDNSEVRALHFAGFWSANFYCGL